MNASLLSTVVLDSTSWPSRPTCDRFLVRLHAGGAHLTACILPPGHEPTCLPPPAGPVTR